MKKLTKKRKVERSAAPATKSQATKRMKKDIADAFAKTEEVVVSRTEASAVTTGDVAQTCGLSETGSNEPPCDRPVVGTRNGVGVCKKHLDPASGALPLPKVPEPLDSAKDIAQICDELKALLLKKNAAYGDAALTPLNVFSRLTAVQSIQARIDDKLKRLSHGHGLPDESLDDTINDLLGYLVLLKIAKRGI